MNVSDIKQLTNEYKYKYDIHAHSKPASACGDFYSRQVVDFYIELGYNGIVLTNHFYADNIEKLKGVDNYLSDFYDAYEYGKTKNFNVILGAELRFSSENENDYLIYGVDKQSLYDISKILTGGYVDFYRTYKNDDNLIIQAHPFRGDIRQAPQYLDGVEVFNCHPGHNSKIALAAQFAKKYNLLVTGGSDFHHQKHQGMCSTNFKTNPKDSFEIAKMLKNKEFVIEIGGSIVLP